MAVLAQMRHIGCDDSVNDIPMVAQKRKGETVKSAVLEAGENRTEFPNRRLLIGMAFLTQMRPIGFGDSGNY